MGRAALSSLLVLALAGAATAAPPRPAKTVPLRVPCSEALDDGTLVDGRQEEALVALAATVPWSRSDGPPSTCHRSVRLTCGPDLNGDGDPEGLVQILGWADDDDSPCQTLRAGDEHWRVTHTFLATRHHAEGPGHDTWRALARVDVGLSVDDPEPDGGRRARFVRRPGGGAAIRVEWSSLTSESGCRIAGYEVLELRGDKLRRVELGDTSRTCSLCDCSR